MRSRSTLPRFLMGMSVTLLAMLAMLATGAGDALAAESPNAATEVETMSFGVLGPVGLAAVILGVVGMVLGVLRQRRKAQQVNADANAVANANASGAAAPPASAARSDVAELPEFAPEAPALTPHRPSAQ